MLPGPKHALDDIADHRQRLSRIRQLPAHQHHQAKAEEQEDQPRDSVLDADHLVIGRDDVFFPEWQFVVIVRVLLMRVVRRVRDGRGSVHKWESDTQYWAKLFKRKAPKTDFRPARCVPGAAPRRESIEAGSSRKILALVKRSRFAISAR